MNTILLISLATIAVVSAFLDSPALLQQHRRDVDDDDDDCPTVHCNAINTPCAFNETYYSFCLGNSSCPANSGSNSRTCTADPILKTLDGDCTWNSDCYSRLCVNSKCNQGYPPGTPCTNMNQCYYRINSKTVTGCDNGKCSGLSSGAECDSNTQCSPPLTCGPSDTCIQPQAAGAKCKENADCVIGAYCEGSTGVCTARLASGSECDLKDIGSCLGNTICTPAAADGSVYKCIAAYSQVSGSTCSNNIHCGEGLNCSYSSTSVYSKCQPMPTSSSFKNCDGVCTGNELCGCNNINGGGVCVAEFLGNPSGIRGDYEDAADCVAKCERSDVPCQANTCHNERCSLYNTQYSYSNNFYKKTVPSCVYSEEDTSIHFWPGYSYKCSGASFAQFSIVVVALSTLVALLF